MIRLLKPTSIRPSCPPPGKNWLRMCTAISAINENEKYGKTCYYTYGPGGDSYGQAMRILHWFNQNGVPLCNEVGVPSANTPGAADVWLFHNQLMWSSTEALILQAEVRGWLRQALQRWRYRRQAGLEQRRHLRRRGQCQRRCHPVPHPCRRQARHNRDRQRYALGTQGWQESRPGVLPSSKNLW